MTIRQEIDASAVIRELDRLSHPEPLIGQFESILLSTFSMVQARIHVITGGLKASAHPETEFDGGSWTGTVAAARYPGIFELARGDAATFNHPEGEHYFFDPAYETVHDYEQVIEDWLGGQGA